MLIISTTGFPHTYYILDANLRSLLHGDVSVMKFFLSKKKLKKSVLLRTFQPEHWSLSATFSVYLFIYLLLLFLFNN